MLLVVFVNKWHSWGTVLLGIPFGQITGWAEGAIFVAGIFISTYFAVKELKKTAELM